MGLELGKRKNNERTMFPDIQLPLGGPIKNEGTTQVQVKREILGKFWGGRMVRR